MNACSLDDYFYASLLLEQFDAETHQLAPLAEEAREPPDPPVSPCHFAPHPVEEWTKTRGTRPRSQPATRAWYAKLAADHAAVPCDLPRRTPLVARTAQAHTQSVRTHRVQAARQPVRPLHARS